MAEALFELGRIVATPGAMNAVDSQELVRCLRRHVTGDWGEVDQYDRRQNDAAVESENRILSAYMVGGVRLWIVTEADRSVTTFLLPEEY